MQKLYKLTDSAGYTRNSTLWGEGVTHKVKVSVATPKLCTSEVLHAYTSPLLAVLLNPIHAAIVQPQLWEAEGEVVISDWDKVGCKTLTTIARMPLPEVNTIQKTAFAILCAKQVCKELQWTKWANAWLSGKDRSSKAAKAAAYAATYTASYASYASYAAANAANAANYAANANCATAAFYAAVAAHDATAAFYAAAAAYANNANYAVNADYAVNAAHDANTASYAATINFVVLAEEAIKYV
jgi:hypothetical protein